MVIGFPYRHDISHCLGGGSGATRLGRVHFEAHLAELSGCLSELVSEDIPLLRLPSRRNDLSEIQSVADRFCDNFERVVLLGTGGSSLGGRALREMSSHTSLRAKSPRLDIITNVDPFYFHGLIRDLPDKTAWVIASKSGYTVETIMQFLAILPRFRDSISQSAVIITESRHSPLGQLADRYSIPILHHDKDIGGRYSVLSVVGILPAMIMGLSACSLREGAEFMVAALRNVKSAEDFPPAAGAAVSIALNRHNNIGANVMLAYSDRLGSLSRWYRQLWAESLGKGGKGMTPIYAMGPVDQHSQLQLWLDGPRDKMFTVMSAPFGDSSLLDGELMDGVNGIDYLRGRSLSDLMQASKKATTGVLRKEGLPVREISLLDLDEYNIGALLMHFMLETILAARLLGVNPFDQPAVDECKEFTRHILRGQDL